MNPSWLSLAITALFAASASAQYYASPTVALASGTLIGTATQLPTATAGVNVFLGVPFAQSPPERFSPPQPVPAWTTPKNATSFSAACIQQFSYPEAVRNFEMMVFNAPGGTAPQESEDCLYLNVFAPNTAPPPGGRPVMFWIHGGGLSFGTAMQHGYDGTSFASYQDVVVVAINYRTNAFGYPSSPALNVTAQNLGFLDQRFALQWVQDNIAQFGGNPRKVTIFGESAGASSVDNLITTNPSNPPFWAAIMESGQASYGALGSRNASTGPNSWNSLAQGLNCSGSAADVLACVRAVDPMKIKSIIEHQALDFSPTSDNLTQLLDPVSARAAGNIAKVPVLIGSNAQEGRVFELGLNNLTQFLSTTFKDNQTLIQNVTALYPRTGNQSDYDIISQIYTDLIFTCPIPLYTAATTAISLPTWRYYFNATFFNTQAAGPAIPLGVYHSSEIGLIFQTYPDIETTAQEIALSQFMQGAWANFAKNPQRGPGWARVGANYTGGMGDVATLGSDGSGGVKSVEAAVVDKGCAALQGIYGSGR